MVNTQKTAVDLQSAIDRTHSSLRNLSDVFAKAPSGPYGQPTVEAWQGWRGEAVKHTQDALAGLSQAQKDHAEAHAESMTAQRMPGY